MNIAFLTYYYPPDLSAGSFRFIALVKALLLKMKSKDTLYITTTHPSHYKSHRVKASNIEINLPYANVFKSSNFEEAYSSVLKAITVNVPLEKVDKFIQCYSRQSIMDKMASYIFGVIECKMNQ